MCWNLMYTIASRYICILTRAKKMKRALKGEITQSLCKYTKLTLKLQIESNFWSSLTIDKHIVCNHLFKYLRKFVDIYFILETLYNNEILNLSIRTSQERKKSAFRRIFLSLKILVNVGRMFCNNKTFKNYSKIFIEKNVIYQQIRTT